MQLQFGVVVQCNVAFVTALRGGLLLSDAFPKEPHLTVVSITA